MISYAMIRLGFFLFFSVVLFFGCSISDDNGQSIIDKAIQAHGGSLYENSIIAFDFRNRHYVVERDHGIFSYHRIFHDSVGTYHDILNNDGFQRFLNDREIEVDAEWARRYSNSVNSVAYFALLPFGLNDPAVNKSFLGEEEINGDNYFKIKVTFDQEGGGEDHEDVFVYWLNKNNYRMDYFGYYYISDGGGSRFREAINQRVVNGLLFSDYHNYKGPDDLIAVEEMAELYKNGKLEKLSDINLENLEVKRFD